MTTGVAERRGPHVGDGLGNVMERAGRRWRVAGRSRRHRAVGGGRWRAAKRHFAPRSERHGARVFRRGRALTAAGLLAALCGFVPGVVSPAGAQAVRGLVIGVDRYRELPDLAGAVNDARDIARALSGAGVRDLVVLENGAATRQRITSEWHALVARAEAGDTLVLAYAGHGGQEPARVPGAERDGLDEVLLLGSFRGAGPGTRERIFDDELHQWFVEAGARDLRVIFVADACHSGTLTRSLDPRAPSPAFRTAPYTITDDMLMLDMPAQAAALDEAAGEAELAHVSLLAAGQEHERVPELALPGETGRPEPRGALSYVFARAVEGGADLDGDGWLRRDELWRFVRENVRMVSEARQTPNLLPKRRGDELVLPLIGASRPGFPAGGSPAGNDAAAPPSAPLRLAILHAAPGVVALVRDALADAPVVSITESPDLIWDARMRQVVTGMGDVAAHGVDLAALPAVIDKWKAVRAIRALSARASLELRVLPHDGTHRRGASITVEVEGLRHPRLTLLALSGNGVVHYLYPLPSDPANIAIGRPFRLPLVVTPPFGADHVVAVSADRPLGTLNAELGRLEGRPAARRVEGLLSSAAAGADGWWSGIQGLFSVP